MGGTRIGVALWHYDFEPLFSFSDSLTFEDWFMTLESCFSGVSAALGFEERMNLTRKSFEASLEGNGKSFLPLLAESFVQSNADDVSIQDQAGDI